LGLEIVGIERYSTMDWVGNPSIAIDKEVGVFAALHYFSEDFFF